MYSNWDIFYCIQKPCSTVPGFQTYTLFHQQNCSLFLISCFIHYHPTFSSIFMHMLKSYLFLPVLRSMLTPTCQTYLLSFVINHHQLQYLHSHNCLHSLHPQLNYYGIIPISYYFGNRRKHPHCMANCCFYY